MSANDVKIKELLAQIESKKLTIGEKPRAVYKTNALIGDSQVNLNLAKKDTCISLATDLFAKRNNMLEAAAFLGVDTDQMGLINDQLDDLKLRVSIIKYDEEKKKLATLEAKLKDLRSNDAKTEDAIAELANLL